jgi:RNA polymerase sigma-70 factor, ECF subfamily
VAIASGSSILSSAGPALSSLPNIMHSTSASLLDQLRRTPNDDAWARLVRLYAPLLYHWAARLGLQANDCADMVQDVFVAVLRGLPHFEQRQDGGFRAWLRTIAVNKWRDRQRKQVPVALTPEDSRFDAQTAHHPALEFEEAEYRAYLVQQAAKLIQAEFHPGTWKAFWATTVEGRPVAEVAAELNLSPNAIYVGRSRILQRLRIELAGILE